MLSKDELTAIRERYEAATEGPWQECDCGCGQVCSILMDCMVLDTSAHHFPAKREGFPFSLKRAEDATFCAHARTDIPRLMEYIAALVADLTAVVAALRPALKRHPERCDCVSCQALALPGVVEVMEGK